MNETIELMAARRSAPPALMSGPGPSPDELARILILGSRVPDHGKLAPWRFIVFEGAGRDRAGEIIAGIYRARDPEADEARLAVERQRFARAPLVIGVVSRAAPHVKIPLWEQELSAGAVCMALCLAANALGYRSAWLTEWFAYDRAALDGLGLSEQEKIAGFVHIGRVVTAIEDRPRPKLEDITTYF